MSKTVWPIFILFAALSQALTREASPTLRCLALEEQRLHLKKIKGEITELNKALIFKLSGVDQLRLKPHFYKRVCVDTPKRSQSLKLLKILIENGKNAFYSTTAEAALKGFQENFLQDLEREAPKMLLDYLSVLQARTATPDCLKKEIPILSTIEERYKILEEDLDGRELLTKAESLKIFEELNNIPKIIKSCERRSFKTKKVN